MKQVEEENAFKHMFDLNHLKRTASALRSVYPQFNQQQYLTLMPQLKDLAMKARVRVLRDQLRFLLPQDYQKALKILVRVELVGFDLWPVTEFIQTYGLDDLELSLQALKKITKVFTSEWAVRPFIKTHKRETMKFLLECAKDKDTSVRRWASEGSRPRLPWGERIQIFVEDPSPTLAILNELKFDDELFVRKSVANHLNDIAKDHAMVVIQLLRKWQKEAKKADEKKLDWIIRHSLRTLIKNGHGDALSLIGVSKTTSIEMGKLELKKDKVRLGDKLEFQFQIESHSKSSLKLVVDYRIHFTRSNGTSAIKVFKLKNLNIESKQKITIEKAHHLKEITTREYYDGVHTLDIQVNGRVVKTTKFNLSGAKKVRK